MSINKPKAKYSLSKVMVFAIVQIAAGAVVAGVFGVAALVELARALFGNGAILSSLLFFAAGVACCAFLLFFGIRTLLIIGKFKKLINIVEGNGNRASIEYLEQELGSTEEKLLADLSEMRTRGFLLGRHIDYQRKEVVLDNAATPAQKPDGDYILEEKKVRSKVPFLMIIFAWAVWLLMRAPTTLIDFIVPVLLSGGFYFLADHFSPKRTVLSLVSRPLSKMEKTGNADVDEVLAMGMENLNKLEMLDRNITSPKIDEQVKLMLKTARDILDYVSKSPGKVKQIKQFLNYYLPTTIKLLTEYLELSKQQVQGENAKKTAEKIEGMVESIVEAFKRQLDNLYLDKAIDISAEIEVMRSMISHEGLKN